MVTTSITPNIGIQDNAYALVALLSLEARTSVVQLQKTLQAELGDALWLMPPEALHITLLEIIQPKPYSQDKQALFERHREEYLTGTAAVMEKVRPVTAIFNEMVVSPQAVILKTQSGERFNAIRRDLLDKLPLPAETSAPPDIIHTSIARFTQEIDLELVGRAAGKLDIELKETTTEFQLVHNIVPPLLKYKTLQTYLLHQ